MLVLERKPLEVIVIQCPGGDVIRVMLVSGYDKTRVGIDAPRDFRIDREEVYLAMQRGDARKPRKS